MHTEPKMGGKVQYVYNVGPMSGCTGWLQSTILMWVHIIVGSRGPTNVK